MTGEGRRYRLYGLAVEADQALPGLPPDGAGEAPALRVQVGAHPPEAAATTRLVVRGGAEGEGDAGALELLRSPAGDWYRMRYRDGTEFTVSADGGRIGCSWQPPFTVEDAATYLYGPVLGFVLRLRGVTCLHASVVEAGGGALLLCGPALAGKSTTAAALAARGHKVLADDVAALREGADGICVLPAYPQLRLWPDAVGTLFGAGAELPALTPNWDKRYLDLSAPAAFLPRSLPVRAVYLLAARQREHAPRLEPVSPSEAVLSLVGNTYLGWLPDLAVQSRDLARYGLLARSARVRRVVPHSDPGGLEALCALIAADAGAQ